MTTYPRTLLHVGCGMQDKTGTIPPFNMEYWREIRLDIDGSVRPDLIGSITNMMMIEDGSIDAIYSSHNIEHLYAHEHQTAFREFARVLKPDGFAVVICPDLQTVCEIVAGGKLMEPMYVSPAGPISAIDTLFGLRAALAQGRHYMAHKSGFISTSLRSGLQAAGFGSVGVLRRRSSLDLWALATKVDCSESDLLEQMSLYLPLHTPAHVGPFGEKLDRELASAASWLQGRSESSSALLNEALRCRELEKII